jgi:hypothetical protein
MLKDLYLVSLITKWSGTEKSVSAKEFFELVESSASIGNWSEFDKLQITVLKITEVAKAFYSSNPELHNRGISWENFKARFLYRFRDVRSDQYHFMLLQRARQKKDETPQEFLDHCCSPAMKTVPKFEDRLLQKFHYDQAQQVLLSAFIARLSGTPQKKEANLVRPGTPLEDQSMDRLLVLAQIRCMQAGSSVSRTHARLTLAVKGNCSALSVGNQDTLPKNAFKINLPQERRTERIGTPNCR